MDAILKLYKSLIRPQMEYCLLKQNMEMLEKGQRRALTTGRKVGLTTFEKSWYKGIEASRIIT